MSVRLRRIKTQWKTTNPADVSLVLTGTVALITTVLLYKLVLLPGRETFIGELFCQRGEIPYVIAFLSVWAFVILVFKWTSQRAQAQPLQYELLPADSVRGLGPEDSERVQRHVLSPGFHPARSFLVNRIMLALEHFERRKSVREVADILMLRPTLMRPASSRATGCCVSSSGRFPSSASWGRCSA